MITVDELKENILGLEIGSEYAIFKKGKSRNKKTNIFKGIFIGESGMDNDFYIFKSINGYLECFLKIDFLINEYGIRKI
ncbi:hypothetical protein [Sporanaerobacter acetigenes]|uniref:Uncharacterized protein n=1 Tax=Sporanaerobacter acetigenes DSM 13106 TaxID=1123281 RepID=A0A1M5UA46_9FIRM|nr:hypothetical protein [Sporanaerobacter acetigenes]SHH59563.1 hypothetical protein SAMN02745180_00567 [Sporanaerobacter acetigenes DSM 13106]